MYYDIEQAVHEMDKIDLDDVIRAFDLVISNNDRDRESNHIAADKLLISTLEIVAFDNPKVSQIIKKYNSIHKWYA